MPPPPPVTHLRLFGSDLCADSTSVRWMLRYSGHEDRVEHVEVDVLKSENLSEAFAQRNHFQTLPVLEVELQCARSANAAAISATKKETTGLLDKSNNNNNNNNPAGCGEPMTDDVPTAGTTTSAIRTFTLTTAGAIMTFLVEHFKIPNLHSPHSPFLRCRSFEMTALHEILGRRVSSMFFVFLFTKAAGTTDDEITAAIQAHERELMWSFRLLDDMLTATERQSAAKKGLDYEALLERGRQETETCIGDCTATNHHPSRDANSDADGEGDDAGDGSAKERRPFVSPTLLALDAYICGDSLSLADFPTACDLNALPYLQSWLPPSLRIEHFPALLRYITRMQNTAGHHRSLKPVLAFLKRFRRRPKILTGHPVLSIHAVRVQQASALSSRGRSTTTISPPAEKRAAPKPVDTKRRAASSTLSRPATHFAPSSVDGPLPASSSASTQSTKDGTVAPRCHSVPSMLSAAYTYTNDRGHCTFADSKDSKETSSTQASTALIGWGAKISSAPHRTVGRLSEEDEARLGQPFVSPAKSNDSKKKHSPPQDSSRTASLHHHQARAPRLAQEVTPNDGSRHSTSHRTKTGRSTPSETSAKDPVPAANPLAKSRDSDVTAVTTAPPVDLGSAIARSSDDERRSRPSSHDRHAGSFNNPATTAVAATGRNTNVSTAVVAGAVPRPNRPRQHTFEAPPPVPTSGFDSMHHGSVDGDYAPPTGFTGTGFAAASEPFDSHRAQHLLRTADPQTTTVLRSTDQAMMVQAHAQQHISGPPLRPDLSGAPPPYSGHGQGQQHHQPPHQGRRARNPYQGSSFVGGAAFSPPTPPTLFGDAHPPPLSD